MRRRAGLLPPLLLAVAGCTSLPTPPRLRVADVTPRDGPPMVLHDVLLLERSGDVERTLHELSSFGESYARSRVAWQDVAELEVRLLGTQLTALEVRVVGQDEPVVARRERDRAQLLLRGRREPEDLVVTIPLDACRRVVQRLPAEDD